MPEPIKKKSVSNAPKIQVRFRDILQRLEQDATTAIEPGGKLAKANKPDAAEIKRHLANLASLARQLDAELEYFEGQTGD